MDRQSASVLCNKYSKIIRDSKLLVLTTMIDCQSFDLRGPPVNNITLYIIIIIYNNILYTIFIS